MKTKAILISGWATNEAIWQKLKENTHEQLDFSYLPWQYYDSSVDLHIKQNTVVIAWSLGTLIALQLSLNKAHKITKLILLSPTARMLKTNNYHGVNPKVLSYMIDKLKNQSQQVFKDFATNASSENNSFAKIFIAQASSHNLQDLLWGLEYLKNKDIRQSIKKIKIPTLIFHGSADKIIPISQAEYLKNNMNKAQLTILNAGHDLPISLNPSTFQKILKFI